MFDPVANAHREKKLKKKIYETTVIRTKRNSGKILAMKYSCVTILAYIVAAFTADAYKGNNYPVTDHGCRKTPGGSSSIIIIKGKWTQIMYTQVFEGFSSCWAIFGDKRRTQLLSIDAGLDKFNPLYGDIIFGQVKMSSKTNDIFDGQTFRCDNDNNNFWQTRNGPGKRQATVMLRRKRGAKKAGIQTDTSCGKPSYIIKDIFVA
eukprot:gene20516-22535_t